MSVRVKNVSICNSESHAPFVPCIRRLQDELEAEKLIKNRLPQLTSSLSKSIPQWENAQNAVFLYKGVR